MLIAVVGVVAIIAVIGGTQYAAKSEAEHAADAKAAAERAAKVAAWMPPMAVIARLQVDVKAAAPTATFKVIDPGSGFRTLQINILKGCEPAEEVVRAVRDSADCVIVECVDAKSLATKSIVFDMHSDEGAFFDGSISMPQCGQRQDAEDPSTISTPDRGGGCSKGCRCGNSCIDCRKTCRK